MLNHLVFGLWFGVWGISSLMNYSRRLLGIWVALMTSISFQQSSQPTNGCGGVAIYSLGASRHDLTLMPLNNMTVGVDKTTDLAWLSKRSEPSTVRVLMSLVFLT